MGESIENAVDAVRRPHGSTISMDAIEPQCPFRGRFDQFDRRPAYGCYRRDPAVRTGPGESLKTTHNGSSLRLPSTAGLTHLAAVRIRRGRTG